MKILFILFSIVLNLVLSSCGIYKDCLGIWEDKVTSSQSYLEDVCKNTITECVIKGLYVKPKCFRDKCCIFLTMDKYDTNPFLSDKDIAKWLYRYFNPHFIIQVDSISECDMNSMYRVFDTIAEDYNLKPTYKIKEGTHKRDIYVRNIEQRIGISNNYAKVEYSLIMDSNYKSKI